MEWDREKEISIDVHCVHERFKERRTHYTYIEIVHFCPHPQTNIFATLPSLKLSFFRRHVCTFVYFISFLLLFIVCVFIRSELFTLRSFAFPFSTLSEMFGCIQTFSVASNYSIISYKSGQCIVKWVNVLFLSDARAVSKWWGKMHSAYWPLLHNKITNSHEFLCLVINCNK